MNRNFLRSSEHPPLAESARFTTSVTFRCFPIIRHDEEADQQVRYGQRQQEIVGDVLQPPVEDDRQTDEDVAQPPGDDEHHHEQETPVVVRPPARSLIAARAFDTTLRMKSPTLAFVKLVATTAVTLASSHAVQKVAFRSNSQ
uniref:Uncharacterized protein n=1 Tax=Tenebrio molitor TaxID=7067 RepID=A0A8J6LBH6_TENMO|nr:hypothetical protein GEV33_015186 [Tenebrio molitor]